MLVVLAAEIADLCGPVAPDGPPSAEDSAAYAQVGDAARASADLRVAATAYRMALARDAANEQARAALAALCQAPDPADADLVAALAAVRRGDLARALRLAMPLAARGVAGAHFVLALVELQRHDGARAERELAEAARDPSYATLAADLARVARRERPVMATLVVEPEIDTNPQLVPDTPPAGATTGPPATDEALVLLGGVAGHPTPWLTLRDVALWRAHNTDTALDYISDDAEAAAEWRDGANHVTARYDVEGALLGGARYLLANRVGVALRRDVEFGALVGGYALRRRDFAQASEAGFIGWVHVADGGVAMRLGAQVDADVRAQITREVTSDPTFTDLALGAQAALHARVGPSLRMTALAALWYASYDGAQPDGTLRRDTHAELSVDVEVDLGDHLLALAGASVVGNSSTVVDFDYSKLVVRAGIALALGGP